MVSTLQAFSIRFDVAAGGLHTRSPNGPHGLRAMMQTGVQDTMEEVIRKAGMAAGSWKVLVQKGFTNPDPNIPLVGGAILDGRGVRIRYRPHSAKGVGWLLLLLPPDMPEKDAERQKVWGWLRDACLLVSGITEEGNTRLPPTDPVIVAQAVEAVRVQPKIWKDFNLFVRAVADEAGPDEPFDYWRTALNTAANQGLLAHGSNCFVVANHPEALKVPEVMKPTASLPPTLNGVYVPEAPAKAKDPQLDDEALNMLTTGADAIMTYLGKVKALGTKRKELLATLAQVQADLARNAEEIKAVAGKAPLENLALASGMLGG